MRHCRKFPTNRKLALTLKKFDSAGGSGSVSDYPTYQASEITSEWPVTQPESGTVFKTILSKRVVAHCLLELGVLGFGRK
jgi:hypothetical protein